MAAETVECRTYTNDKVTPYIIIKYNIGYNKMPYTVETLSYGMNVVGMQWQL